MPLVNFKKTEQQDSKILADIKQYFQFLISEYGYQLKSVQTPYIYCDGSKSDRHVCTYINERSKLQVEVAGSGQWFHCQLRRFKFGVPSSYSDYRNSLGFETFAKIESTYDHKKYIVLFSGWNNTLQNTVDLFRRHKAFFSEKADETDLTDQLKEYSIQNNLEFNELWEKIEDPFFLKLKTEVSQFLISAGYLLLRQSSTLAPYDETAMIDFIEFQKNKKTIKISQLDWRDSPQVYYLTINRKQVLKFDLSIHNDKQLIIKQLVNKLREIP